jgi:hypothetical protein
MQHLSISRCEDVREILTILLKALRDLFEFAFRVRAQGIDKSNAIVTLYRNPPFFIRSLDDREESIVCRAIRCKSVFIGGAKHAGGRDALSRS